MDALKQISQSAMKAETPDIHVGDTVKVHVRIKEGNRERIQLFEGTVIAKKHGGISETFREGFGDRQEARRHFRNLHGTPRVLRLRDRACLPAPLPECGEGGGRQTR